MMLGLGTQPTLTVVPTREAWEGARKTWIADGVPQSAIDSYEQYVAWWNAQREFKCAWWQKVGTKICGQDHRRSASSSDLSPGEISIMGGYCPACVMRTEIVIGGVIVAALVAWKALS